MLKAVGDILALVLRGNLPYPDLVRRTHVRRAARSLISRTAFPTDDLITAFDLAQLALLRALDLQQQTRRAVRGQHREAAVLLARSSMDVSIVGLWCLREPRAVAIMREAQLKSGKSSLRAMLTMTGVLPDDVLERCLAALGPSTAKMPPVRNMAKVIDTATGADMEADFYQRLYDPLSAFFVHANAWSLSRHIGSRRQRKAKPTMPWARRSPVRVADACVGLIAAAVATAAAAPADLFADYTTAHAMRVLPPFTVSMAKSGKQAIGIRAALKALVEVYEVRKYLAGPARSDTPAQQETRIRQLFDFALGDPAIPSAAISPAIDYFVSVILSEGLQKDAAGTASDPTSPQA